MSIKSERERCDGCQTPCSTHMHPTMTYAGQNYKCPCTDCLIKMACTDDCPELTDYFHKSIELAILKRNHARNVQRGKKTNVPIATRRENILPNRKWRTMIDAYRVDRDGKKSDI